MKAGQKYKISPAKEAAYISVTCALLLGGQYVFSFVVGVEIVTVLLVCFSSVFGVRRGVILAASFSLLRCCIFGFTPAVFVLYIVYYPALAAVFGGLGHFKNSAFGGLGFLIFINLLLISVCTACALAYALDLIKISRLYKITVEVLLWVIFALCALLLISFNCFFIAGKRYILKVIAYAAIAAVCTVCFTLLDDLITPLFLGMNRLSALAYFYASFTAMLPQTVCTIVTVTTLLLPVTKVLSRFRNNRAVENLHSL
ncbi:MAG: hypothetical protein K2O89_07260 [Clostridia bacterium]|nr:hypothetical protein [Clostridia bacterium]